MDIWETQELDAVIDTLEPEPSGLHPSLGADELDEAPAPPPLRSKPSDYKGRTEFPDLFEDEPLPAVSSVTGPEEKLEAMRKRLKSAEALITRFQDAWRTREREMDMVEALLEEERAQHASAASQLTKSVNKLQKLDNYLNEKKEEFRAYGEKVEQVFKAKDDAERTLREKLDEKSSRLTEAEKELEQRKKRQKELTADLGETRKIVLVLREEAEEFKAQLRGDSAAVEWELRDKIERLNQERESAIALVKQEAEQEIEKYRKLEDRHREEMSQHEESLQKVQTLLDRERLKVSEVEAMLLKLQSEAVESGLDPESSDKLTRALQFALKVVSAELTGEMAASKREELLKRARIALSVAESLAQKIR